MMPDHPIAPAPLSAPRIYLPQIIGKDKGDDTSGPSVGTALGMSTLNPCHDLHAGVPMQVRRTV